MSKRLISIVFAAVAAFGLAAAPAQAASVRDAGTLGWEWGASSPTHTTLGWEWGASSPTHTTLGWEWGAN